VLPKEELKESEKQSVQKMPNAKSILSRYTTSLNRLRFIDTPREMMFFMAYMGYLATVKDKVILEKCMF
jgi:hypothetical protein